MPAQPKERSGNALLEDHFIGGKTLAKEPRAGIGKDEKEREYDGQGSYRVLNPLQVYLGKSYVDWTTDWFNWFLSADADKRNSGPVVFLRSHGIPNKTTGAFLPDGSEVPFVPPGTNGEYRPVYINDPNIRIGSDRLQIFADQGVFVPIIVAYDFDINVNSSTFKDWGEMQEYTGLTIDYGDNPPEPDQLTINNQKVELGLGMEYFRIATSIFPAVVPDTQYGRSVKDFLEDSPILPGRYSALVEGYFVMLKFTQGMYWVHSWASAPREKEGPYFSELLYQIEVLDERRQRSRGTESRVLNLPDARANVRPSRNERLLKRILSEKQKTGELTNSEVYRFQTIYDSLAPPDKKLRVQQYLNKTSNPC